LQSLFSLKIKQKNAGRFGVGNIGVKFFSLQYFATNNQVSRFIMIEHTGEKTEKAQ